VILVDTALERRARESNPIKVALAGAGYMGRGIALQVVRAVPGIELVAIASRDADQAGEAFAAAGRPDAQVVSTAAGLADALAAARPAVTADLDLLAGAEGVEAVIEATGDVEAGAALALASIESGKHVVLVNAELDGTLGPLLKARADRAGVVVSYTDGDEPGLIVNLSRYAYAIGLEPVLAGNLKGLLDPYRTPDTQREFAAAVGQKERMVTSFADGTKLSLEAAITANALGFRVARRGMTGHRCGHVNESVGIFDLEELLRGGIVDFLLGAQPGSGAFVVAHGDDPDRQSYLRYFKLGDGPLYTFYQPWHLPNFDVPLTVARAALFHDAAVTPLGAPRCEVVTLAKRDLPEGAELDGIGGFDCYGAIDNAKTARAENLLPIGLSKGCRLGRDVAIDEPISFDDVQVPPGRLVDRLWTEQLGLFADTTVSLR
jgi:predicted homoserine dehydrogenase-like protein